MKARGVLPSVTQSSPHSQARCSVLRVSSAALLAAVGFTVRGDWHRVGVCVGGITGVVVGGAGGTVGTTGSVAASVRQLGCNGGSVGHTCGTTDNPGWLMQWGSLNDGAGESWVGSEKKSAGGCYNVRWLGPSSKMTFHALMTAPIAESKSL